MTSWMFVALIWFDGGPSWPDVIWSFTYKEQAVCDQSGQDSALFWSRRPKVAHVFVSECFRWATYAKGEV